MMLSLDLRRVLKYDNYKLLLLLPTSLLKRLRAEPVNQLILPGACIIESLPGRDTNESQQRPLQFIEKTQLSVSS